MKLFMRSKESTTPEQSTRMARLSRTEYSSLLSWFDTTIMGLGASFDKWRYHDAPLEEVGQHLEALNAVYEEIKARKGQ